MAHPLLGILAFALVTAAAAGVVVHTTHPNPANAPRGEACGHEKNETHDDNETADHEGPGDQDNETHDHDNEAQDGAWTHNESGEHDATSGHENNASCDRDDADMDDHEGPGDNELNETEDEASLP